MPRTLLLILIVVMNLFSSCGFYDQKAKQVFYELVSGTNDSLDRMTTDWHRILDRSKITKNFAALAPFRNKMGLFISRNRAKIADIEVPQSLAGLRDSEEVFLSTQANIISDAYPAFEPFNDITPEDDIQNQMKLVANDLETETSFSEAIRKSLRAYAQSNRLKPPHITKN